MMNVYGGGIGSFQAVPGGGPNGAPSGPVSNAVASAAATPDLYSRMAALWGVNAPAAQPQPQPQPSSPIGGNALNAISMMMGKGTLYPATPAASSPAKPA
ncbi:hypothetical protein [Burkholderia multivorans]|uniref:hypothetical protein n=1 Tax=Burkholderia multivorans TaxID=87883 RepID=UPI001C23AACC|nr:hypothetical protein [Burkholderia multivorans]ULR75138.1 hypothetical protein JC1_66 [Burkholderia phage JC1]MBU9386652.1 hypothetical protein [Burkholderia multivorans]MBU9437086.1 hypothetical protein [Burkholderia multivorans]MBU9606291.1 hypothetical protein [Burkholderia multivorans]MBU9624850.1 hypothetical protein [Burkholderia multivorans]